MCVGVQCRQKTRLYAVLLLENRHEIALTQLGLAIYILERCLESLTSQRVLATNHGVRTLTIVLANHILPRFWPDRVMTEHITEPSLTVRWVLLESWMLGCGQLSAHARENVLRHDQRYMLSIWVKYPTLLTMVIRTICGSWWQTVDSSLPQN